MLKRLLIIPAFFTSFMVVAQTPDSLLKPSPVKSLSAQQYNALLNGDDLYGMSQVAEQNGFPLPEKALKYKREIDLSPMQVATLTKMNTELKRKKVEMGSFIIANETKLEAMFRNKKMNEGDLIFYTNRYGLYHGELRNAILQAAYKTWQLLSPQQVNKLLTFKNHN